MKTILIPNDLSPVAENAFAYSVEFALSQPEKIQLILLHVFDSSVTDPAGALTGKQRDQQAQQTIDELHIMAAKYIRATGLRCVIQTARGQVEDQILDMAAQHKADYIFMGTKGAKGLKAFLYGSNTSRVLAKATCPVLAIPEKALFSPLNTLLFASNFQETDYSDFRRLTGFAGLFNSRIVLLHLSEKNETELDLRVLEFVRSQIKADTDYHKIEIATLHADNFAEGLDTALRQQRANLLVMAPRRRTFLESLFSRSRTQQMAMQANIPLLALPAIATTATNAPELEKQAAY